MSRKTERLTVDHLAELADPVRSCLFWELGPVDRARLDEQERIAEKESWLSSTLRDWGSCGRVVRIDGRTVGHIVYAPAARLPGAATLPTAPGSPDAIIAATAWIEPALRRGGLGRLLVQAMAADLVGRGHTAIEAYGDTRGRTEGCVLPAEFLGSVGFKTQRAHPTTPRMRMELRTALSWKDEVELALEKVWGVVRPTHKATRPIGSVRAASGNQVFSLAE
ncbi:GNAT family N-acetyltransferase [Nocardioides ganghwensis]|uniref:GNAT family N-acetyltransferase n=1 Tax=Nocardioides ganghwensis TaxID=252230 RepID=A0A4Q2S9B3_9ACTN|nr:GNAT family N-acetyltransferase [Nocardioides ganghwensis]MBD3947391.1 GNAT family N-acetyltransferase [Nocardioides ganghwensis]RYC00329.1 GNAT family N-acetyltransferase [Nocardioides ganghwensis]